MNVVYRIEFDEKGKTDFKSEGGFFGIINNYSAYKLICFFI